MPANMQQDYSEPVSSTTDSFQQTPFYRRLSFIMSLGLLLFVMLVLAANYYVAQSRGQDAIIEQANRLNQKVGETIVLKLRERLSVTESLTTTLANLGLLLPKDEKMFHKIIPHLIEHAGMQDFIAGGGIWPEPNSFSANKKRRSFFWGRDETGVLKFFNGYNSPEGNGYHHEEWYVPARFMVPGSIYWSRSYLDPYSREPMVTCTVPMWNEKGFQGVATIDLKLTGLSEFMAEQAKLFGGYAFAVDRSNRLLSFPAMNDSYYSTLDLNQYPTINMLTESNSNFGEISRILNKIDEAYLARVQGSQAEKLELLSEQVATGSYQIEQSEAMQISALLLGETYSRDANTLFFLESDPVMREPTSVNVFTMPDTGWKLIVAMPATYTDTAVSAITENMLSLLFVLVSLAALIFVIFFRIAFLAPVKTLIHQVQQLLGREDYTTKLEVKSVSELSQLAYWFNTRTAQLAEVLDQLRIQNKALGQARLDSDQANQSKNIFLASMSHEIRTQMNAIIGMSDLLTKAKLEPDERNYTRVINSSAQALLSLVNDIMDFSKIEANQLDLETIPFNLRTMLDDCADVIEFQAFEKKLEFIYFLSPDVNPYLQGDPGRLRQIILNLAGNALKFTRIGRIELWVEPTFQSDKYVQLHVEVRDTGIGLSRSAQENMFLPFTQGDPSITRKYGGTGLGLTISKDLAELMGGSIDFRSEEGVGSIFIFNIKLMTQSVSSHIKDEFTMEKNNNSASNSLLVLGQNHFQNAVIERYAEALSYECKIFYTLQNWLDALLVSNPECCISICSDQALLGDIDSLTKQLPAAFDHSKMIILKSQNEPVNDDLTALEPFFTLLPLTLPLKFDAFKSRLSSEKYMDELIPAESESALDFLSHKRILVVEDNDINQKVLLIMLKHLGLAADVANDGVEAVEAQLNREYDLILMDWQMPRMDGLEATREIRASRADSKPVIIAVTANAMSGDIDKCLEAGMNDYISKPIRREQLEQVLRQWLAK